jgi:transposase
MKENQRETRKRRTFSPEAKAEIVMKVLREEETLAQIASEYGVHPTQLSKWKVQFLRDAHVVFQNEQKPINELKARHDKELDGLYAEIGKLTAQLSWLKKKCGGKYVQE